MHRAIAPSRPEERSGDESPPVRALSLPEEDRSSGLLLVVEDQEELRTALRELLESEGYAVVTAEHGEEALTLLRSGLQPRLVLLDMLMPVMDGPSVLAACAEDAALRQLPVLVVSATTERVPCGARGLLRKPVGAQQLLDAVARHLTPVAVPAALP